jgi:hypothetical protein
MKEECDMGKAINVNQIKTRVSEVTGVSLSTLKHILKDYEQNTPPMVSPPYRGGGI